MYFCLVIWHNNIWLFGLNTLGYLAKFYSVIYGEIIRLFVEIRSCTHPTKDSFLRALFRKHQRDDKLLAVPGFVSVCADVFARHLLVEIKNMVVTLVGMEAVGVRPL